MTRAALAAAGLLAAGALAATLTVRAQVPAPIPSDPAAAFAGDDVHAKAGLTCESCHGPARAGAPGAAPVYAPVARTAIAPLCATCHQDAAFMRKFAPQVRVDQYAQYKTSVHGQQMAKGDTKVATCSDCHHAHGILQVRDARSPVAPSNVATTCARCHTDASRMEPYGRSPQVFEDWSKSVHADALLVRGDRSAPTCNTCHGSHGATPPGIDDVVNVCAQCHVREAELFAGSPKRDLFEAMGQGACIVCHSNHQIEHPNETWISLEPPALCATCHDDTMGGAATIRAVRKGFDDLTTRTRAADGLLTRAETAGMLVEDGEAALRDAIEAHVQMRVLVHAFADPPFAEMLGEGLSAAGRAQTAGDEAMAELNFRRRGLAVATLVIIGFLITLFVKIRRLPPIGT